MSFRSHHIIIILSSLVIISYLFNLVSRKTRIPSVLLLIGTGLAIKYMAISYGLLQPDVSKLVKVLGISGLIMIVLEAALDLKLGKNKIPLIRNSFGAALFIFLISAFGIAFIVRYWLEVSFLKAFLYAVPMSIISSAIVIPSTEHLPEEKREFIIYESSFSDIIGILVFNYLLISNVGTLTSYFQFGIKIGFALVLSLLASLLLIFILSRIQINLKFFLIFAVLSLLYSAGELIHVPALMIVLVFGIIINNVSLIIRGPLEKLIRKESINSVVDTMKVITAETSFLIRTFFFILFGYTIKLNLLILPEVWTLGSLIVLLLLIVRFIYLKVILSSNLFPELFLMPRGLVTILLFYSIPEEKSIGGFNDGILFFVVAITSILMMLGLLLHKKDSELLDANEKAI
jgi:NhaP-type Na+/H+ or K+/H+ antiporter